MNKNSRFFGLHFDFHANNEEEIGMRTLSEDIQWYIDEANPEYIQCDCKGHPGNSSYPTKVGYAAKLLKNDNLRIWCDVAKQNNIPIYVHYSGLIDERYLLEHPEDAKCEADGEVSTTVISPSGKYCDKLLIPQLKELITEYGIDGVWVDGDCWAVYEDYSENAKPYIREGMTKEELKNVWRAEYLKYLQNYVDELHNFKNDFKIISNWAYSSYMPVKPETNLDFLSGDVNPVNSVHEIRYEGRCLAAQNMPWDLMSWTFTREGASKSSIQLMQEAATVLSLGGGYEMYMMQNKDGSAKRSRAKWVKEVSDFVHKRKCLYEKRTIGQIGLFYSAESAYKMSRIFNAAGATINLIGTLDCILDAQYTLNIILDYQMDSIKNHDMVVVPEWKSISEDKKTKLMEYAQNGGNLIIIGAELCSQYGEMLNENFGNIEETAKYILDADGNFACITGNFIDLKSGDEKLYFNNDLRDEDSLFASRTEKVGKGKIVFVPFDLGTNYFNVKSYIVRNFMQNILNGLSKPIVTVNRKNIDISLQENVKEVILNLVNFNQGRHELKYCVYDNIPEIYDVEVIVRGSYKVLDVLFADGYEIEKCDGYTKIKLKKLEIHSAILMEKQEF